MLNLLYTLFIFIISLTNGFNNRLKVYILDWLKTSARTVSLVHYNHTRTSILLILQKKTWLSEPLFSTVYSIRHFPLNKQKPHKPYGRLCSANRCGRTISERPWEMLVILRRSKIQIFPFALVVPVNNDSYAPPLSPWGMRVNHVCPVRDYWRHKPHHDYSCRPKQ